MLFISLFINIFPAWRGGRSITTLVGQEETEALPPTAQFAANDHQPSPEQLTSMGLTDGFYGRICNEYLGIADYTIGLTLGQRQRRYGYKTPQPIFPQ